MSGKSKAKGKDIRHPSPIEEEDNVDDVQMVAAGGSAQQPAPLASAHDFPPDHWVEPGNDEMPPSSPAMASEDNIRFSPLPVVFNHPSPVSPSGPGHSAQYPLSHDEMEAMLAQIRIEMEELRTHDRMEIDVRHDRLENRMDIAEASDSAMSMQIDDIGRDMRVQKGLLAECTAEVRGIVRYLREQRSTQVTASTPPAFNPPPMTAHDPSISAFARTVTNNVFTPDVSWMGAQTGGDMLGDTADGSPVARHNRVPSNSTIIPSLTMRESGPSVPPVGAPPVQSPILPVAGPSNVPADAQSVSAPLPRPRFGPLSHQGRSVSARYPSKPSSDGPT